MIANFGYSNSSFIATDSMEQIHGDFTFFLDNDHYHMEFQTDFDATMVFRVFSYGMSKAKELAMTIVPSEKTKFVFPQPLVIYLEENSNIVGDISASIEVANKTSVDFTMPVIKMWDYTYETLIAMEWYLLIPFTLISYRKKFKKKDGVIKHKADFIDTYRKILTAIRDLWTDGKITAYLKNELHICLDHLAHYFNEVYIHDEQFGEEVSRVKESPKSISDQIQEEARKAAFLEIALTLLKKEVDIDIIMESTKVPREQLLEMKKKLVHA